MVLTPHSIVGAAIANLMPENPELSFALAWASHYAIDMIPHRDYDIDHFFDKDKKTFKSVLKNTKAQFNLLIIGFDFVIGVGICFLLFVRNRQSLILTLVGIAGGVLPDILQFIYYTFKKQPWIFFQKIHDIFHNPDKMMDRPITGTLTQAGAIVLILWLYFLLKQIV